MKNLFLFLLAVSFSLSAHPSTDTVRRAAFDIGSGQIKVQVSDIDLKTNRIANVLFTGTARVALREDLVKNLGGRLSGGIQNKTIEAISELLEKIAPFNADAVHAIATEPLRLAKNGQGLIERIKKETGLDVSVVSQDEEGILGFVSAVSVSGADPEKAISWDFGGGSFQITTQCDDRYFVYQGRLGRVPLKNALLQIQGKNGDLTASPNPISQQEADQAVQFIKENIKDVPQEILQKLHRSDVVILGVGIHPLWGMPQNARFDVKRVHAELRDRLNLDDEKIRIKDSIQPERKEAAHYVVSNLILAFGVMESLKIDEVQYVGTQGANAVGLLLSPKYWNQSKKE